MGKDTAARIAAGPLAVPLSTRGGSVPQPAGSPPPYTIAGALRLLEFAKRDCDFCGRSLEEAPEMILVTNRGAVICDRCSDLVALAVKTDREHRAQRLAQLKRSAGIPDQPA